MYEKSLQLSSIAEVNMGQITNHMSSDAANVMQAIQMIHFVLMGPLVRKELIKKPQSAVICPCIDWWFAVHEIEALFSKWFVPSTRK